MGPEPVRWRVMPNERRSHRRIAVDAPATIAVSDAEPAPATIANFSQRGLFIRADVSPGMHRPVHVQFILRPDHALCEASGKVAWQAPNGIGVFFDTINEPFLGYIEELARADESIKPEPKRALRDRILDKVDVEVG